MLAYRYWHLAHLAFMLGRMPTGRSMLIKAIAARPFSRAALFLPLAFLGSVVFDFPGLLAGVVAANVAAGILAIFVLKRALEKSGAAAPAAPRSSA